MEIRNHTITLVVNNKPDVLARIAGIFSGRGFNIESISANVTLNPEITKIILVTKGNTATIGKIENQLRKLVDVLDFQVVVNDRAVLRELILVRIPFRDKDREKIRKDIENFHCRTIRMEPDHCILEITGTLEEIQWVLKGLEPHGIEDLSRSGLIVLR
jgi:acetolactate synthase-1/3 small subunit